MARVSLSQYRRDNDLLSNSEATAHAVKNGYRLGKYADPIEGALDDIDEAKADEVAAEDAALVWIEIE